MSLEAERERFLRQIGFGADPGPFSDWLEETCHDSELAEQVRQAGSPEEVLRLFPLNVQTDATTDKAFWFAAEVWPTERPWLVVDARQGDLRLLRFEVIAFESIVPVSEPCFSFTIYRVTPDYVPLIKHALPIARHAFSFTDAYGHYPNGILLAHRQRVAVAIAGPLPFLLSAHVLISRG